MEEAAEGRGGHDCPGELTVYPKGEPKGLLYHMHHEISHAVNIKNANVQVKIVTLYQCDQTSYQ